MNHIKDALEKSPILSALRKQLREGGSRDDILSLLSIAQRSQVIAIECKNGKYVVKLKSAYALFGIKAALKNSHLNIRVVVQPKQD